MWVSRAPDGSFAACTAQEMGSFIGSGEQSEEAALTAEGGAPAPNPMQSLMDALFTRIPEGIDGSMCGPGSNLSMQPQAGAQELAALREALWRERRRLDRVHDRERLLVQAVRSREAALRDIRTTLWREVLQLRGKLRFLVEEQQLHQGARGAHHHAPQGSGRGAAGPGARGLYGNPDAQKSSDAFSSSSGAVSSRPGAPTPRDMEAWAASDRDDRLLDALMEQARLRFPELEDGDLEGEKRQRRGVAALVESVVELMTRQQERAVAEVRAEAERVQQNQEQRLAEAVQDLQTKADESTAQALACEATLRGNEAMFSDMVQRAYAAAEEERQCAAAAAEERARLEDAAAAAAERAVGELRLSAEQVLELEMKEKDARERADLLAAALREAELQMQRLADQKQRVQEAAASQVQKAEEAAQAAVQKQEAIREEVTRTAEAAAAVKAETAAETVQHAILPGGEAMLRVDFAAPGAAPPQNSAPAATLTTCAAPDSPGGERVAFHLELAHSCSGQRTPGRVAELRRVPTPEGQHLDITAADGALLALLRAAAESSGVPHNIPALPPPPPQPAQQAAAPPAAQRAAGPGGPLPPGPPGGWSKVRKEHPAVKRKAQKEPSAQMRFVVDGALRAAAAPPPPAQQAAAVPTSMVSPTHGMERKHSVRVPVRQGSALMSPSKKAEAPARGRLQAQAPRALEPGQAGGPASPSQQGLTPRMHSELLGHAGPISPPQLDLPMHQLGRQGSNRLARIGSRTASTAALLQRKHSSMRMPQGADPAGVSSPRQAALLPSPSSVMRQVSGVSEIESEESSSAAGSPARRESASTPLSSPAIQAVPCQLSAVSAAASGSMRQLSTASAGAGAPQLPREPSGAPSAAPPPPQTSSATTGSGGAPEAGPASPSAGTESPPAAQGRQEGAGTPQAAAPLPSGQDSPRRESAGGLDGSRRSSGSRGLSPLGSAGDISVSPVGADVLNQPAAYVAGGGCPSPAPAPVRGPSSVKRGVSRSSVRSPSPLRRSLSRATGRSARTPARGSPSGSPVLGAEASAEAFPGIVLEAPGAGPAGGVYHIFGAEEDGRGSHYSAPSGRIEVHDRGCGRRDVGLQAARRGPRARGAPPPQPPPQRRRRGPHRRRQGALRELGRPPPVQVEWDDDESDYGGLPAEYFAVAAPLRQHAAAGQRAEEVEESGATGSPPQPGCRPRGGLRAHSVALPVRNVLPPPSWLAENAAPWSVKAKQAAGGAVPPRAWKSVGDWLSSVRLAAEQEHRQQQQQQPRGHDSPAPAPPERRAQSAIPRCVTPAAPTVEHALLELRQLARAGTPNLGAPIALLEYRAVRDRFARGDGGCPTADAAPAPAPAEQPPPQPPQPQQQHPQAAPRPAPVPVAPPEPRPRTCAVSIPSPVPAGGAWCAGLVPDAAPRPSSCPPRCGVACRPATATPQPPPGHPSCPRPATAHGGAPPAASYTPTVPLQWTYIAGGPRNMSSLAAGLGVSGLLAPETPAELPAAAPAPAPAPAHRSGRLCVSASSSFAPPSPSRLPPDPSTHWRAGDSVDPAVAAAAAAGAGGAHAERGGGLQRLAAIGTPCAVAVCLATATERRPIRTPRLSAHCARSRGSPCAVGPPRRAGGRVQKRPLLRSVAGTARSAGHSYTMRSWSTTPVGGAAPEEGNGA